MDVERVIVRLFADATPYTRAMREAEGQLIAFAGAVSGYGRLLDVPFRMAAASTIALTVATTGASFAALKLAADYETVGIALEVMTGSAATGKQLLQDINKMAVETPFKSTGLQTAAKSLGAFGVEAEQIIPTLHALGDVASGVAGKNLDEMMGRVVLAFGQVKTAGRLMGPESRQFIEAGVPIYEYLAKVMDKPRTMIKGLIEEGKVGFPEVVRAFNLMTAEGGRFFGMMDRQSQTTMGRWSAFVETLEIGLRNVGLAAFEGLQVKETLDAITKSMGDLGREGPSQRLITFFQDVRSAVQDIVGTVKLISFWLEKGYNALRDWGRPSDEVYDSMVKTFAIMGGILLVSKAIALVWTGIAAIWALMHTPLVGIVLMLTTIALMLDRINAWEGFGQGFEDAFKAVEGDFKTLVNTFKEAFAKEDWNTAGKIVGLGFKLGFTAAWAGITTEMEIVLMDVIEWFVKTLGTAAHAIADEIAFQIESIIPGVDADQRRLQRRATFSESVDELHKEFDKFRANIRKLGQADLDKELQPLREELRNLQKSLLPQEVSKPLETGEQNALWLDFIKDTTRLKKQVERQIDQARGEFVENPSWAHMLEFKIHESTAEHLLQIQLDKLKTEFESRYKALDPNNNTPEAIAKRQQMRIPLGLSAEATRYAGENRREMAKELEKGIGFGGGQFTNFNKALELINEAQMGPLWNVIQNGPWWMKPAAAAISLPMGEMGPKEGEFARFREFEKLRHWVGVGQERLPPAAMAGSVEAMDIINRSNMMQTDRLTEILQVLKAAELLEAEQKKIMEETNRLLIEAERQRAADRRGF